MKKVCLYLIATTLLLVPISWIPSIAMGAETNESAQKKELAAIIPDPGVIGNTSAGDRPTQLRLDGGGLAAALNDIWNETTRAFYYLIGAYAVIVLSLAAFQYGSASGNTQKTAAARASIVQTILGIALMVASMTIISLIWSGVRALT